MESKKKTGLAVSIKSLQTAGEASRLRKYWYAQAQEAKQRGWHVAWCMGGDMLPVLLLAMEVVPIFPENYGTVCAVKQVANIFIDRAAADGFSKDICTYALNGLGYACKWRELGKIPSEAPYGGMAEPDMLLANTWGCDVRLKWFQALGRYLETPYIPYDLQNPLREVDCYDKHIAEQYIQHYLEQMKAVVAFVERCTGKDLNMDRLRECIENYRQARRLWYEVQEFRKVAPSPMPSQDYFTCIFPVMWMSGTREAVVFYRMLYDEVKRRVENKMGAFHDEKFRLMWSGFPMWFNLAIFNYFERFGAVFVIEDKYHFGEVFETDVSDPLEALARMTYWDLAGDSPRGGRIDLHIRYAKEYKIDGLVIHHSRSCPATSIGQMHIENVVGSYLDLPTLSLESDLCDVSYYSDEQIKYKIDTFMEFISVKSRKFL